jgi:hypothetical protein
MEASFAGRMHKTAGGLGRSALPSGPCGEVCGCPEMAVEQFIEECSRAECLERLIDAV